MAGAAHGESAPDDWSEALAGPAGGALREALAALPWPRIRVQPPPRPGGLPLGNEWSVWRRHRAGASCHMHPSGLSERYRARAPQAVRRAFDALVLGRPLPPEGWDALLGSPAATAAREAGLLEAAGAELRARFRVVCVGASTLLVDPLAVRFAGRVHIGHDSLKLVEFLAAHASRRSGRVLDVGTGSGVVLLEALGIGAFDEAVGVDINPRAVAMARFNAALAGRTARLELRDVFAAPGELGRFDLVTWNAPFRFFPDEMRGENMDGFGGHLGIELTLRFLECLPELLAAEGEAFVLTSGPILADGSRPLEEEAAARARAAGLRIDAHVRGRLFDAPLASFHARHGVRGFESTILRAGRGAGGLTRHAAPAAQRLGDGGRALLHALRQRRLVPRRPGR